LNKTCDNFALIHIMVICCLDLSGAQNITRYSVLQRPAVIGRTLLYWVYRVGQIKWHHFTFLLVTN